MKTIFLALISLMLFGSGLAYAGDYTSSAHGNSTDGVSGRLSGYGIGNCAHCHEQHASVGGTEGTPEEYLLFQDYQGTSYNAFCTDQCHSAVGSWGGDDIASQYEKTYHHPTTGVHTPGEDDPADFANRHSYCIDCHNPHVAQTTLHTVGSNDASGPLLKVSGVSVSNSTAWTAPSYTFIPASTGITKEYQLCFKCHSSWTAQPGGQTNIAMQFNPANASFHPVELGLDGTGSGSSALTAGQMNADWQNVGAQTMYCSDCHGDDATGSPPSGPHGSDRPKIINDLWPRRPNGQFWYLYDAKVDQYSFNDRCLCKKCHVIYDDDGFLPGWQNNAHHGWGVHQSSAKCVSCHVGLPHGYKWGRLIAERDSGHPYHYDDDYYVGSITAFTKKSSPTAYVKTGDCIASSCALKDHRN